MTEREKVIKGLECCNAPNDHEHCPYDGEEHYNICTHKLLTDAIALLKAQEPATVEPKRIDLADETKAWLDKMDAVEALSNIANICMDWDGYRTANGLGGLINEIWAYARYCANRLFKAHEPRVMTLEEVKALPSETDVWLDEFCSIVVAATISCTLYGNAYFYGIEHADYGVDYKLIDYGKEWRCWTSRPTEEQREAVKWDD